MVTFDSGCTPYNLIPADVLAKVRRLSPEAVRDVPGTTIVAGIDKMEYVCPLVSLPLSYVLETKGPGEAMATQHSVGDYATFAVHPKGSAICIAAPEMLDVSRPSGRVFAACFKAARKPALYSARTVPALSAIRALLATTPAMGAEGAPGSVESYDENPSLDPEGGPMSLFDIASPTALDHRDRPTGLESPEAAAALPAVSRARSHWVGSTVLLLIALLFSFRDLVRTGPYENSLPIFSIRESGKPIKEGLSRELPKFKQAAAMATLNLLTARGIVVRCGIGDIEHISPLVAVMKPDGRARITIDLRTLNSRVPKDPTYLPSVKDFPSRYIGCWAFSKIDMCDAFFQFGTDPGTARKLGFAMPDGSGFAYLARAPQGASNMPGHMQDWLVKNVISEFHKSCSKFGVLNGLLDDLVLGSRTPDGLKPAAGSDAEREMLEAHVKDLEIVFSLFRAQGARVAADFGKCIFLAPSIPALGLVFDGESTSIDPERVAALKGLVVPARPYVKFVRIVIGKFSYYRDAVNDGAYIRALQVLHDILNASDTTKSHAASLWSPEATEAFYYLRDAVVSSISRYTPDYNMPLYVYCDASVEGWGALVVQYHNGVEHPVAVLGKPFVGPQLDMKVGQKEAYAILAFVRHFGTQLRNWNWTLRTDHNNLLAMAVSDDPLTRRWFLEICQVCTKVQHIAGTSNVVADAMSRLPYRAGMSPSRSSHADPRPCPSGQSLDGGGGSPQLHQPRHFGFVHLHIYQGSPGQ
jgi:hypothetical protein